MRFVGERHQLSEHQYEQTQIQEAVEDREEKATAPHSSTLAWRSPWTEEPGGLQSTGLQRVRHD